MAGKWSQLYTLPSGSGDAKFNKFVGGPNGFATLGEALATAVPGDAILVRTNYTMAGNESVTVDNIHIEFAPNAKAQAGGNYYIGVDTASGVSILNANIEYNTVVAAAQGFYLVNAENCRLYGCTVKSAVGGFTLTNAIFFNNGSLNNMADIRVDLDTLTNLYGEAGTAANNMVNVTHKQSFMGSSVGKLTQDGDTTSWNNYPVIDSPVESAVGAGSHTFDCSQKSKFLKTGGAGTFTLSNMKEGQTVVIIVTSTGSAYSITWSPAIRWPNGSVPTPTLSSGRHDIYNFVKVGGVIYGTAALDMY